MECTRVASIHAYSPMNHFSFSFTAISLSNTPTRGTSSTGIVRLIHNNHQATDGSCYRSRVSSSSAYTKDSQEGAHGISILSRHRKTGRSRFGKGSTFATVL